MERGASRVGSVIRGKYRLDRLIGEGGMAVVYAATHRNNKRFAIKMLHPELSFREDTRQRFVREGYVANTVGHAGAVSVVDDDVAEDGSAFIVMELLEGRSVEDLQTANGGKLPLDAALAIGAQLLDVLAAAHAHGIVHRDIKPANLFLLQDGTVKVLDFGIARLRELDGGLGATKTGALMGTPAFLPPEQAGGRTREVDGQTDVWAVGATLFNLLTGEYVHVAENPAQMVVFAATQPARSIRSVVSDLPAPVVELVDRALAFDRGARWPTAQAMRDALEAAYVAAFGQPPSAQALSRLAQRSPAAQSVVVPPPTPAGGTTAQPVSESVSAFLPPKRNRWIVPTAALLAVSAAAIAFGTMAARHANPSAAVSAIAASSPAPLAIPPPPPPSASTSPEAPPPKIAVSAPPTATATMAHPRAHASAPAPTSSCHVVTTRDEDGVKHFKEICD